MNNLEDQIEQELKMIKYWQDKLSLSAVLPELTGEYSKHLKRHEQRLAYLTEQKNDLERESFINWLDQGRGYE